MSCEGERGAGGLAISRYGVRRGSGARALLLNCSELMQLFQIVATAGQLGYRLPEFSFTDLFPGLGADQLPQLAAAQFPWVESQCVHSFTVSLLLR